jgi:hypothetical protein
VSVLQSKSSAERTLSIDLLGGIGNQLFRYYAATTIAEKLDLRVRFFLGELPESHSQFNSRIQDLGFSIVPERRVSPKKHSLFLKRISNYLSAKSVFLKKVESIFSGIHIERGLGILEECNLISKKFGRFPFPTNIHLDGHFQDILYFSNRSSATSEINFFRPANLDSLVHDFQKQSLSTDNICVVHIRRGDFKNHKNDIGLLSKDYYENAMSSFVLGRGNPHFFIISDDISEAKAMVTEKYQRVCTFVHDSEQMNPAALMWLVSKYKNFILSNSTFSLWIALLAPETKYVSYPFPFNRNLALQVRGFPVTWKPELAYFEE